MARNEVRIDINAKDQASGVFKNVQRNFALAAAAMGAAAVGVGIASVKMAADFDKGMREVNTLLRLPEAQFKTLQDETLELSKQLGIAASDAVPALYQAISAGIPRENVMEFLTTSGKFAIAGVTDLTTAVDGLTSVVNAYGREALSTERAADIMFATIRAGKTTAGELSAALFNVIPSAVRVGISFEEVGAALATLTTQGVLTSVATTQLRSAIDALSAPTIRQKKTMEELGLSFTSAGLAEKGLAQSFAEVIAAAGGDDSVLRRLVGSVEALSAITIIGGTGQETFARTLADTRASAGDVATAFEEMEKSAARAWDRVKTQLGVLMIQLGSELLPIVVEQLEAFSDWVSEHEDAIVGAFVTIGDTVADVAMHTGILLDRLNEISQGDFGGVIGEGRNAPIPFLPGVDVGNDAMFQRLLEREQEARIRAGGTRERAGIGTALGADLWAAFQGVQGTAGAAGFDPTGGFGFFQQEQAARAQGDLGAATEAATAAAEKLAEALRDRLTAAMEDIAEKQTVDVVQAFIRGGDDAVAAVRAEQSALNEAWEQVSADLRDKLGIAVPEEFRLMWEQILEDTKDANQRQNEEMLRAAEQQLQDVKDFVEQRRQIELDDFRKRNRDLQSMFGGAGIGVLSEEQQRALFEAYGISVGGVPSITVKIGERELTDVVVEAGDRSERQGR